VNAEQFPGTDRHTHSPHLPGGPPGPLLQELPRRESFSAGSVSSCICAPLRNRHSNISILWSCSVGTLLQIAGGATDAASLYDFPGLPAALEPARVLQAAVGPPTRPLPSSRLAES
jgi:hypothetical protein